ncbi:MAG: hypothetical protein FJX45_17385 [Alphaproteobacteria bacterium]|nr:hypothetical protein [Alphaproteobacteria bacterium]
MAALFEIGTNNEKVTALLEPYIQSGRLNFLIGSGASCPAIQLAGDIEQEINALLASNEKPEADMKCLEFLEAINRVHDLIRQKANEPGIAEVTEAYSRFIALVDSILFARKNLMLPRQATIFTTNYDMFVEHASSLVPGVILNDGFDRTSSLEPSFVLAPERYFDRTFRSSPIYGHNTEIPTINLVKLHGSLSWRHSASGVVFNAAPIEQVAPEAKTDPDKVHGYLQQHFLVLPNLQKFHDTLMIRVYYDMLRLFSKAMDQENALLIAFGFSFTDEHILDITRRSLRNPTSHLLIVAHDASSVAVYQDKFAYQRNVSILAPSSGSNIDFARFNEMLAAVIPNTES